MSLHSGQVDAHGNWNGRGTLEKEGTTWKGEWEAGHYKGSFTKTYSGTASCILTVESPGTQGNVSLHTGTVDREGKHGGLGGKPHGHGTMNRKDEIWKGEWEHGKCKPGLFTVTYSDNQ